MKKAVLVVLSFVMVLCFVACGTKTVDIDAFKKDVTENVEFAVELNKIENSLFSTIYGIELPKNAQCEVWCGSAAAADQFAVFEVQNSSETAAVKKSVEELRDALAETYSSYATEQLDKINNAVIRTGDKYVIFIITDDYKNAATLADKYF